MWRFDKRMFCGASLIICLASGCCAQRGMRQVGQCGQGHSSLMEWAMSRSGSRCDNGVCDDGCYQGTTPAPPQQSPAPVAPPTVESPGGEAMVDTDTPRQIIRPERHEAAEFRPGLRRRILKSLPDASWFSIELPRNVFGRTSAAADAPADIPWDAPVAVRSAPVLPKTTQVVEYQYEYRQPVQLQAPELQGAGTPSDPQPSTSATAGHSINHR